MIEEKGQILKSIGFPIAVLTCVDRAATQEGISRSAFVVKAVKAFIKNYDLEKKTGISI